MLLKIKNTTMSLYVQNKHITSNLYTKIKKELIFPVGTTGEIIELFDIEYERVPEEGDLVHLPFAWARNNLSIYESKNSQHIEPVVVNTDFLGKLRVEQEAVRNEAYKNLQETRSTIISANPGFGKTVISIELICALNVPTLILVNRTTIAKQWIDSIAKYAPTKRVIKMSSKMMKKRNDNSDYDIYVANPVLFKEDNNTFFLQRHRLEILQKIKLLVVDELHQVVSKINHKAFFKVSPDYFLGLSATPYRPENDPMVNAISLFFGDKIVRTPFFKEHTVYIIKTGFSPKFKLNIFTKKLDWNHVLESQATNVNRNKKIVECLKSFPNRIWLVLVKRVEHAKLLHDMLKDENLQSSMLTGTTRDFDKSTKILIGTTCKIGTGFDHSPINGLVIASDCVEYFEQFLGRCMRTPLVKPIVVDFEDSFKPLVNHLNIRITKYKACGGNIIYENIATLKTHQRCSTTSYVSEKSLQPKDINSFQIPKRFQV